jgi:hypothetical protein
MTKLNAFSDHSLPLVEINDSGLLKCAIGDVPGAMSCISPSSITGVNSTLGPQNPIFDRNKAILEALDAKRETIAVDWLEITVKNSIHHKEHKNDVPNEIKLPGLTLKGTGLDKDGNPVAIGTKHFQARYNAFFEGEADPFCTILTFPRIGGVLPSHFSQIKIENRELYANGWTERLKNLLSLLRVELNNVTRLDVAIDSNCVSNDHLLGLYYRSPFIGLYQRWRSENLDNIGRTIHHAEYLEARRTTGFDWGRRSSDKFLTAYIKSETLEKDGKEYIQDFWNLNGIKSGQRVERLEIKLKSEAIKRLVNPDDGTTGIDIFNLENPAYLAGIMRVQLKGFFDFTLLGGDSNKSRRDKYETVDWESLGAALLQKTPSIQPENETWAAKQAINKGLRDSDKEYAQTALKMAISETVGEAITDDGMKITSAVVALVQAHLKATFHYFIPESCFAGIAPKLGKAIAADLRASISDDQAKALNVSYFAHMAKAHDLGEYFERKTRLYGIQ